MNNILKAESNNAAKTLAPVPISEPVEKMALTSAVDHGTNIPGFIFLCNGKTKPECFYYRVFGLPMTQWKLVERIKPGTKLFLFDYDMRVLYGIYEAASKGAFNIEPAAFEGRFSAQVKFVAVEECPPLAETTFKKAIMEDYRSTKIVSELNESQVNTLVSLFRSLSSSSTNPVAPVNAAPQMTMPSPRVLAPRPIQPVVQVMQHHNHIASGAVLVNHVHHSFQHHTFPNPIGPSNAHFRGPYFARDHMQVPQEPYPRYNSEVVPQYHPMGFGPMQEYNIWYHPVVPLFREPNVPAIENPALAYPVPPGSYLSSTLPPNEPVPGIPVLAYSLPPDLYFPPPMQPIFAPAPVRPEPNYIFPTASYVSSTIGPESGMPRENHPLNPVFYASYTIHP